MYISARVRAVAALIAIILILAGCGNNIIVTSYEESDEEVIDITSLLSCYEDGRVVIGTDSKPDLPIWNWTAEISQKILEGETLQTAMEWLDHQAGLERNE